MHSTPVLHPLPDAKLPQVKVSLTAIDHWKSEARDTVHDVVHNRQSWYFRFQDHQHLYKSIYTKRDIQGGVRVFKSSKIMKFLSRGKLNMTLDTLAYGLHSETTAEQRSIYAQLYQDTCVDGALLKQFQGQQPHDSFHSIAVKWIAFRSPLNKIFHMRDFVFFEYCFTTTDADGRKVLVEYKKSQRFRPDELHNHDLDISRGSVYMLNTYYMEDDHVVMHSQGNIDVSGSFPAWFAVSVTPIVFNRIRNYHGLAFARSLTDTGIPRTTLASQRSKVLDGCRVCRKQFKFMRGKKWCRGCGHAVCRDCVADVILTKNEIESSPRLPFTRERFCILCLITVQVAVSHQSKYGKIGCHLSIDSDLEPCRMSIALQSIDELLDLKKWISMDDSLLTLSFTSRDEFELEDLALQCNSRCGSLGAEHFTSTEFKKSALIRCICLIDTTRIVAEQAATLRSFYQRECQQ